MSTDRFSEFSDSEISLIFEALLFCIESNSGIGFRSHCQDRIEYQAGAKGEAITMTEDREDTNTMFHFFRELSLHMADSDHHKLWHRRYGITDWQAFCRKAVEAASKTPHRYTPLQERDGYYQ